ncbi:hypothetical protein MPPM_5198 [Methylorubrum populi]|uniref:Uncharacterized protein n=1 Tax=Methylorubrum populi TaxID=223967 RepID=A0A160PM22_9HYPH|nr:hypothetical protein [Methylorubrum populi]BAU93803.1 hypothetical protein MPPM_5198 [Methylorubrum populi]
MSFGKNRNASWVHFDIAKGKRALAIQAGAIETDRYGASYFDAQRRGNARHVERIELLRNRNGLPPNGFLAVSSTNTARGPRG